MTAAEDDLPVLAALWRSWADVGQALGPSDWTRPTRCEGWDVAALYAHVSQGVSGLSALAARRRPVEKPDHADAAAVIAALKPGPDAAARLAERNAAHAREDAASVGPAALIARFRVDGPAAVAAAEEAADAFVDYFRHGVVPMSAAVTIRLAEATIHLLDLRDALGGRGELPPGALSRTAQFLLSMTPLEKFVELATGRGEHVIFPVHA
jgi:uncharacterized protein (TIGR03083 family)